MIVILLISNYGFLNFWSLTENFKARQNITSPKIEFYNEQGLIERFDTIRNKVVVFDIWTTSCRACFKGFPDYEKLYLEYKNNPKVKMYALNVPLLRDSLGQAKMKMKRYNYKFPKLYAKSDSLTKSLGINSYPHLLILKNGKIRFNGALILKKDIYLYNLKNEIDLLLEE